jgi:transaldolase / glucose-6-phosphate isomerase
MSVAAPAELVERIWAYDATVWTGSDEARWLGWLDEALRVRERVDDLLAFAARADFDDVVLLGMGGSSLAPLVMARAFGVGRFHVLDTTHPKAVRRFDALDLARTLFVVSSKSGTTIETRCHLDYFRERGGTYVAVTDPGSPLEEAGIETVFHGEPTIGGRYSALSPFGIVPAALMGLDVRRLLDRAEEMREACRLAEGNPGLELGLALARAPFVQAAGDFGLWVEQLLAESTGKDGKGIVPVVEGGEPFEVRLSDPYELGQEFFRWEFATAVAGALLGLNPFDQPDVQSAKDMTQAVLSRGQTPGPVPEGDVDELLDGARDGDYVAVQAFIDPERESELSPLLTRVRERGLPLAVGLGPRYLHSTGQLHKGGPDTVIAVQVVDDPGEELPIPGREFGFRRLIEAQAEGDFQALKARGRRVCRLRLEDL